jgi:hypothetical protein
MRLLLMYAKFDNCLDGDQEEQRSQQSRLPAFHLKGPNAYDPYTNDIEHHAMLETWLSFSLGRFLDSKDSACNLRQIWRCECSRELARMWSGAGSLLLLFSVKNGGAAVERVLSNVIGRQMIIIFLAKNKCTALAFCSPLHGILVGGFVLAVYPLHPSQLERILAVCCPVRHDLEMFETLLPHGPVGTYYAAPFQSSNQHVCLLVDRMCLLAIVAWSLVGSPTAEVDGLASVVAGNWEQVAAAVDDTRPVVAATAVDSPEVEAAATLDESLEAAHCKASGALLGADVDLHLLGD